MRKILVYVVVVLIIATLAYVISEVTMTREVVRDPEVRTLPAQGTPVNGTAFTEPVSGKDKPWTVDELAWALKERVVLDILEAFASTEVEIDAYNERVAEYDELASVIHYRDADMAEAVRLVYSQKETIVREALHEASAAPKLPHGDEEFERVWRAQSYLRAMGYYLGTIDGKANDDTDYAVMSYQINVEEEPTGTVDEKLLSQLEESLVIGYTPETVSFETVE